MVGGDTACIIKQSLASVEITYLTRNIQMGRGLPRDIWQKMRELSLWD